MNTLNYFIEANISIIAIYGMYRLLLSNETDFRVQRGYLLIGLFTAVLLPFVRIGGPAGGAGTAILTRVLPELVITEENISSQEFAAPVWSILTGGLFIYLGGMVVILVPMIAQGYRLFQVFSHSEKTKDGGHYIVESPTESTSYSFFNIVVIGQTNKLSSEERNMIILHEKYHGKLLHSADALIMTLFAVLLWFNPVIWIYRRTMLRIHEYQVDAAVACESSSGAYSILLAKSVLIRNGFFLAHPFNQSFILKRINMINKLKKRVRSWKLVALVSAVVTVAVVVACTDQVSQSEVPASSPESAGIQERPSLLSARLANLKSRYPGTTFEAIRIDGAKTESLWSQPGQSLEYLEKSETRGDWAIVSRQQNPDEIFETVHESSHPVKGMTDFYEKIAQVITYPEQARMHGIEGKVFVQFVVQPDGRLSNFKVVKGLGAGCDAAALNAVMQMEAWTPGKYDGKVVAQQIVLPIVFKLN